MNCNLKLNELIKYMDEPMSDSAIIASYLISKEAKKGH